MRFGAAADVLVAGEGIETMLALKSVLPLLPMIAALSANHLAAVDLSPALFRRLYVVRDNDAAGINAASGSTNAEKPPGSKCASSCRFTAILTPISAASAPWRCSRTSFLSSPLTTSPVSHAPRICTDWREAPSGLVPE